MTIRADHYAATERALRADPIIQDMAEEIRQDRRGGADISDDLLESWQFIQGALSEYRAREGTVQTHIGGPATAIRQLLKETA